MFRRSSVRRGAALAVVALIGASSAVTAAAAPPEGVSMAGTGPQPPGLGLFSKAALADKHCAQNGATWGAYEGSGPWCVNPWPATKNNGGATAQGVTPTEVNVVAYVPNEQMIASNTSPKPMNVQTKQQASTTDSIKDAETAYEKAVEQYGTYQLWGRKPVFDIVTASGPDEAAQRADAVAVIAKKPFMVFDLTSNSTGAPVFSSLVAAKKIVVWSAATDAKNGAGQAPYRWNYAADPSSTPAVTAAFVGKSLAGKPAKWAGADALKTETRKFGVVYPTTGFDIAEFERLVRQNGGILTEKRAFDPAATQASSEDIGTAITRLKSSGVTSVILVAPRTVVAQLMSTATAQDYFPEWIYTGFMFQEYTQIARSNDAKQMAHAFGLAQLGPYLTDTNPAAMLFQWYWGPSQGNEWAGATAMLGTVLNAMHYAGPDLTAKNLQKGLFAAPATKTAGVSIGLSGYGRTVGTPYVETANFGSDRALVWWDPEAEGQALATPVGKGVWEFLNNGESITYKQFTKTLPKFFDKSASVTTRSAADYAPGGVAPTILPCDQCPSSGGAAS